MDTETQDLIPTLGFLDLCLDVTEDLHQAWRVARNEALLAYRAWCVADEEQLDCAYFAYVAAADREEAAALRVRLGVEPEGASNYR